MAFREGDKSREAAEHARLMREIKDKKEEMRNLKDHKR
jgi:hypothetical protein